MELLEQSRITEKKLGEMEKRGRIETNQTTALQEKARTFRRILEIRGGLLSLKI